MRLSKAASLAMITAAAAIITSVSIPSALAGTIKQAPTQWAIEIAQVEGGDVNIEPEFKVAIYENLIAELTKTKQFSTVIRSGDRHAEDVPRLFILRTTVESYSPGSETKRAVTTVAGATKLKVRSQLCTTQGSVVYERILDGNVRFFGTNLRATQQLARTVAKAMGQLSLPDPSVSVGRE